VEENRKNFQHLDKVEEVLSQLGVKVRRGKEPGPKIKIKKVLDPPGQLKRKEWDRKKYQQEVKDQ
jgi:hypothetical protein